MSVVGEGSDMLNRMLCVFTKLVECTIWPPGVIGTVWLGVSLRSRKRKRWTSIMVHYLTLLVVVYTGSENVQLSP